MWCTVPTEPRLPVGTQREQRTLLAAGVAAGTVYWASTARQAAALTRDFDDQLDRADWPAGHADQLDGLVEQLRALDPEQANAAQRRLHERAAKRIKDALALPRVTAEDVNAAVAAAQAAFPGWADTPPIRRARVLNDFLGLLNQHKDTLAAMITAGVEHRAAQVLHVRAVGYDQGAWLLDDGRHVADRHAGFTVLEILISVAIIAVLLGISMATFVAFRSSQGLDKDTETVVETLEQALRLSRPNRG